jgi:hypothetical protein
LTRSTLKLNPLPRFPGWRCRKCSDSVNTMTRTCRGCGLVVARTISKDPYVAESKGPEYQPPVHAFPDDDTPLGALRPLSTPLAQHVRSRRRRPRVATISVARGMARIIC